MEVIEQAGRRTELSSHEQETLKRVMALKNISCCKAADYSRVHNTSVHRGVSPGSASVVFGNDGFSSDIRSRVEVCKLVEALEEGGIAILGFGLDADSVTWTLQVDSDDHETLDSMVYEAWLNACEDVYGESLRRGEDDRYF